MWSGGYRRGDLRHSYFGHEELRLGYLYRAGAPRRRIRPGQETLSAGPGGVCGAELINL